MQRRPTGVTASAVVLGLMGLFLFFAGLFDITVAVQFAQGPRVPLTPTTTPVTPQHLMAYVFGIMALIALLCAVWGLSTFKGLLRMRSWARISIMILAGCLAGSSLLDVFINFVIRQPLQNPVAPWAASAALLNTNPDALGDRLLMINILSASMAAIGIWWLIYYARRGVRKAFAPVPRKATRVSGAAGLAALARPVSMSVVAILAFLGALCLSLCCLLPVPLVLFGVRLSVASANVVLISLAALYALAGFGLLRMVRLGWVLAVGMQVLGLLNLITMLVSPLRRRWIADTHKAVAAMLPASSNTPTISAYMLQQNTMNEMFILMLAIDIALLLLMLVLLWRARWAYTTVNRE